MKRNVIHSDHAPQAIGPYSQAIAAEGRFVFVAGQIGLDPAIGKLVEGGIEAQARQVLENLKAILEAAGTDLKHVVKTSVLLHKIADFPAINAIYGTYFTENPPARATFGGLELPLGALVEIECVALIPN